MKPLQNACLLSVLILCFALSASAQPGTLSSSFGNGGLLLDPSRQSFEKAIASQGLNLLIGSQGFSGGYQTFLVDRLLPDGSKDASFGMNGSALVLFHDNYSNEVNSDVSALALQPDGRIIAAGRADGGGGHIALARLLPDGTPDTSFGSNGTSLTGFNIDETLAGLALQPDGKMVVCGITTLSFLPGDNRFFVARYLPNGNKDSSFGNNGIAVSSYAGSANAVLIQPDGNIVAGGYYTGTDGISFHIERYQSNGSYDNSFGNHGIADSRINGGFINVINDMALQKDGKILAAGRSNGGGTQTFTLVRYNSNGSFDNSFGNGGVVMSPFLHATGEAEKIMMTVKEDHIVVAGNRTDPSGGDFVVASYDVTGLPDTAFGNGGIAATDFGGSDFDNSATMCANGKIVVLGSNTGQYPFAVRALVQYNGYPVATSLFVKIKRWLQNHIIMWNGISSGSGVAYYAIEQSYNAYDGFTEIGRVNGSAQLKEYNFTNSHLLQGDNYYRIKAVGKDNSITYSEIVKANNALSSLSVYPNPAKDVIVVNVLITDIKSTLTITNSNGNVMMSRVSNGTNQYRFYIGNLQQGTYYINVITPGGKKDIVKFMKE